MGNEVGTQRRNLFVPVPRVWDVDGRDERLPGRSRDMSRKELHGRGAAGLAEYDRLAGVVADG